MSEVKTVIWRRTEKTKAGDLTMYYARRADAEINVEVHVRAEYFSRGVDMTDKDHTVWVFKENVY